MLPPSYPFQPGQSEVQSPPHYLTKPPQKNQAKDHNGLKIRFEFPDNLRNTVFLAGKQRGSMGTLDQVFQQAFVHHQSGDLEAAERGYARVLQERPQFAEALYLLGSLHAQRMDYSQALPFLQKAAALDSRQARYCNNLGIALKETGRWDEAAAAYARAISLKPDYPEAFNNRGILCKDQGRLEEASSWFRRAVASRPDYAEAYNNLGLTLKTHEAVEEAAEAFHQAVIHQPNFSAAHNNLGAMLRQMGRLEEASVHVAQALALQPDFAEAYNNWGIILHEMRRDEEAEAQFRRALTLCPRYPDALLNLGSSVQAQGRFNEALECFEQVLSLEPHRHDAQFNRALLQLMRGEFAEGWDGYEWRFRDPKAKPSPYHRPRWDGSPLAGRTLLVYAEQGFGDTFQFIRYLSQIPKDGGRIIFECQPGTKILLEHCDGFDEIIERGESNVSDDEIPHDVQIALMSLPRLFPHSMETPPCQEPYIHVPLNKVTAWGERLEEISQSLPNHAGDNLKIGIVWAGNPTHKNDKNRSASLAEFAPLAQIPGVTFYSLQVGVPEEQAANPPAGMTLINLAGALQDFTDTAAILMHLDLVISVDTSTAHLAGALGRPVWLLLPFIPEWRWLEEREDSPWYPSMRLFRQAQRQAWAPVFAKIAEALAERTGAEALPAPRLQETIPKISVLMCTYNRLDLLPRVLDSYAAQTLPTDQYELILVDDASTDGTQQFIETYQSPFTLTYHRQAQNAGIGAARKQTVALARGEVVLFADDDEIARPDYLAQHLRTHRTHPQENYGVHARIELAPEVADSVTMQVLTGAPGLYHYFDDIPDGAPLDFRYFWTNVVSIKRSFLMRHEPFDDTTRAQEDVEMGRRLGQSGLVLIHNKRAVMDTLRRMTYTQFCHRQDRIGAATAWLTRKHGASDVPFWVGVGDLEANMPALKEQFEQIEDLEPTMEALEQAGWNLVHQTPGFLTQTFPHLARLCRMGANYHFLAAYHRQMQEYHVQEAATPVVPNTRAVVSIVLTGDGDTAPTLESLRAQTYPHWELVTTFSPESHGDYVLCLEAGDQLLPTFLAECVSLLERTPEIGFVYGDWQQSSGLIVYEKDYRITPDMEHVGLPLKTSALIRSAVCAEVGQIPIPNEAWDFWLAAAAKGYQGRRIPKPLLQSPRTVQAPNAMDRARLALQYPQLFAQAAGRKAQSLITAHQWQMAAAEKAMPTALISVVLTLRHADDLAEVWADLKAQTYPRFEVILVNCTGTTLVRRVLKSLRQPVKVITAPLQASLGEARNLGIQATTGQYVTYLDPETKLNTDHLAALVTALDHTAYPVVYTASSELSEVAGFDYDNILIGNPIPSSALMHTRVSFDTIGEFDPALSSAAEWDFWIRLSRQFDVLALSNVTCQQRNAQTTVIRLEDVQAMAHVFEKHRALLPDIPLFMQMQQAVLDQMQAQITAPTIPKISVLMCTYNRLDLLPRVLDSYAAQTLPTDQYELILVDDASTDGTQQFIETYQSPFTLTYHRQTQNMGIAVGRNQALALARSEIVVFVDDDETARPDYLAQHLRTHAQYPEETVAVCGRVALGAEADASVTMHILTENPGLYHYFEDLRADRAYDFRRFWGNVVSAKRAFLLRHGGFDAETQAQEDVELGWRLHPHGLTVRYNPDAVLDTLRVMTLEQFLRRQSRIGAASAWLSRKHPHPEVIHWLGVTDAEARLPRIERHLQETQGLATQMDALEQAGWEQVSQMPGFRERTFPTLSGWVKAQADEQFLTAYVRQVREYQAQDAAQPMRHGSEAHVSIIVTTSDTGLSPTDRGLESQTHPHWDLTVAECRPGEIPAQAWNRVAGESQSPYLLRLGDWDVLSPTFLAECVALMERAPELALVYTDATKDEDNAVCTASDYLLVQDPRQPGLPPNTGVVIRRAAWKAVGGWPVGPNPDWNLWRLCGEHGRLGRRLPKPLLHQKSHLPEYMPSLSIDAEVARAERLFGDGDTETAKALLYDLQASHPGHPRVLNNLGVLAWQSGDKIGALRHFRDALEAAPQDRTALENCADALQALGHAEEAQRLRNPLLKAA
jgi:glycosyltransferase involved in cell wall biosynthesis/Flp pilus assembly protein TadD